MSKNAKIILAVVLVVAGVGGALLANNADLFQGGFGQFKKGKLVNACKMYERGVLSRDVITARWFKEYTSRVASNVTSGATSRVPSVVTSDVPSRVGASIVTSRVPSIVTSEVTSGETSKVTSDVVRDDKLSKYCDGILKRETRESGAFDRIRKRTPKRAPKAAPRGIRR